MAVPFGGMEKTRKLLEEADRAYYEGIGVSSLTDAEYDALRERYPRDADVVGSEVDAPHARKVTLPQWMGSMDKRTVVDTTSSRMVVSDKLDGVSALFTGTNLFTRGNGRVGRDISHLMPLIRLSETDLGANRVRGELVISKSDFDRIRHKYSNARNTVSGFVNSKDPDESLGRMVHFVAYELTPSDTKKERIAPKEQFRRLKALNMRVVHNRLLSDGASTAILQKLLQERGESGSYEIDGLIVANDTPYAYISSRNPSHAFAFKPKTNCISANTVVREVVWGTSKDGFMKPRVMFDPVELDGARIKFATGENARYIRAHRVGPGAVVEVIRSGKVIPHIVRVVKPASEGALPTDVEYSWTPSGVDIVVKQHGPFSKSAFTHTLKKLEIPNLGDKKAELLYDKGYNTLGKVMRITRAELMQLDGFKEKSATNLIAAIDAAKPSCMQLMVASNSFGRGLSEHVLRSISDKYPLSEGKPDVEKVKEIDGVGPVRAQRYVSGYDAFLQFLTSNDLHQFCRRERGPSSSVSTTGEGDSATNPATIVLTGFRDASLASRIGKSRVANNITKRTAMLVVDYKGKFSQSKIDAATEKGVRVLDRSDPLYARVVSTRYDESSAPHVTFE